MGLFLVWEPKEASVFGIKRGVEPLTEEPGALAVLSSSLETGVPPELGTQAHVPFLMIPACFQVIAPEAHQLAFCTRCSTGALPAFTSRAVSLITLPTEPTGRRAHPGGLHLTGPGLMGV